jgi:hypothetical protein
MKGYWYNIFLYSIIFLTLTILVPLAIMSEVYNYVNRNRNKKKAKT